MTLVKRWCWFRNWPWPSLQDRSSFISALSPFGRYLSAFHHWTMTTEHWGWGLDVLSWVWSWEVPAGALPAQGQEEGPLPGEMVRWASCRKLSKAALDTTLSFSIMHLSMSDLCFLPSSPCVWVTTPEPAWSPCELLVCHQARGSFDQSLDLHIMLAFLHRVY